MPIHHQRPGTNPPIINSVIITGLGFLFGVGGLGVLALNLAAGEGGSVISAIVCLGSASLAGWVLAAIGIRTIRQSTAIIDYHVTDTALQRHRNDRLADTYPYDAFSALRLVQGQRIIRRGPPQLYLYPAIILEGDFETIELGIDYGDFIAEYDARDILQDLLPYLPASVAVESAVSIFAETGEMPLLRTLPKG